MKFWRMFSDIWPQRLNPLSSKYCRPEDRNCDVTSYGPISHQSWNLHRKIWNSDFILFYLWWLFINLSRAPKLSSNWISIFFSRKSHDRFYWISTRFNIERLFLGNVEENLKRKFWSSTGGPFGTPFCVIVTIISI